MIDLTKTEKEMLAAVRLHVHELDSPEEHVTNGERVMDLMNALLERGGIPRIRTEWFTNPELNIGGRGNSRKEIMERNGTKGDSIFSHPHFLKHFRYFLSGPGLPAQIVEAFRREVEACGMITSGDIIPLSQSARRLATKHNLKGLAVREEFFKLSLECSLDPYDARIIRDAVK